MRTASTCSDLGLPATAATGDSTSLGHRVQMALAHAFDAWLDWRDRVRSRQQLMSLDDRLLHDIGLDRASAMREGQRWL